MRRNPNRICTFPPCDKPVDSKDLCQGHYRQMRSGRELQPLKVRARAPDTVCTQCGRGFRPRSTDVTLCSACRKITDPNRAAALAAPRGKKWCIDCQKYRSERSFHKYAPGRCKPCHKRHTADLRAQRTYGLGPGDYQRLYAAQGGVCWICRRATGASRALSVDHDHKCCPGTTSCGSCVRGLICSGCNYKVLGHFRDDTEALQRAIDYLLDPPAPRLLGFESSATKTKE